MSEESDLFDRSTVRDLLKTVYVNSVGLESLCVDHFPDLYDRIESTAEMDAKINAILVYFQRSDRFSTLLQVVKKDKEEEYMRFVERLKGKEQTHVPWGYGVIAVVVIGLIIVGIGLALGWFSPKRPPKEGEFGDTWTRPADAMVMVYVPPGTFQMGSDRNDLGAEEDEFPPHWVTLSSYWIDQTEVSNAQYARCVNAGECRLPSCESASSSYGTASEKNHPVVCVSWSQARAYCEWAGGQLPTEAEWEYAARGPKHHIYPWGNTLPEQELLNFNDPIGHTEGVGSYPKGASWCGALDMAGNVWEWTSSHYSGYPDTKMDNERFNGGQNVMRGGGWQSDWRWCRAANRAHYEPTYAHVDLGFRCVIEP